MNRHRSLKFISRAWITALYTILVFYLFRIIAVSLCLVIVEPLFFVLWKMAYVKGLLVVLCHLHLDFFVLGE